MTSDPQGLAMPDGAMRKDLVFVDDGVEYMKLCVDVTAYWMGSFFSHEEGVLHFYNQVLDVTGGRLQHFKTSGMTRFGHVGANALNMVSEWFRSKPPPEGTEYILILESSSAPNAPSDTAFCLWALEYETRKVGAIRLMLPIASIDPSPQRLQRLAAELVSELDFHSGNAGYAVNWDFLGRYASTAKRSMRTLAKRFPGIELPHVVCALEAIPHGIKRVNWLTLLGAPLVERLGGTSDLRARFGESEVLLEPLKHGVMIAAGNKPGLGDVNRREGLEPYHVVGRVLSDVRSHSHPPFLETAGLEHENVTEQWLSHFDR